MNIGYLTEPEKDYVKALDSAFTQDALIKAILPFRLVAEDALLVAKAIKTEKDWQDFRAGLRHERRGEPNSVQWMERYAAILLPAIMLKVSMVAQRFGCPWGVAYIRLRDEGVIKEVKGVARWRGGARAMKLWLARDGVGEGKYNLSKTKPVWLIRENYWGADRSSLRTLSADEWEGMGGLRLKPGDGPVRVEVTVSCRRVKP